MTIFEFDCLDYNQQFDKVLEEGIIVSTRIEKDGHYVLFQLNSFYVEIKHIPELNSIDHIKNFVDLDRLDPYLDQINLEGILAEN